MAGSGWMRAGLAMAALGFAVHAMPASPPASRAFGQSLLAEYQLPGETVARYAAFVPTPQSAAHSQRLHMTVADKVSWTGPLQSAGTGRNPYTLVLTVSGVARAAGDVATLWQAGWEVRETPSAFREVTVPITEIARKRVAAGTPLTLTAAGTPMSFRDPRDMAAMVGLVSATNLDISDVRVQVWTGAAPWSWPSLPRLAPLAFGAAALLIALGLRSSWRPARAAMTAAAAAPMPAALPALAARETPPAATQPPVADAELVPVPVPVPVQVPVPTPLPAPSHESRVTAALRQVLTVGLAVATVLDETRPQRSRRC